MPASGFITYEQMLIASYIPGGIQNRYDGDTTATMSVSGYMMQLTSNGVDAVALDVYSKALLANQLGLVGAQYDGDTRVSDALAALRAPLFSSYSGPQQVVDKVLKAFSESWGLVFLGGNVL